MSRRSDRASSEDRSRRVRFGGREGVVAVAVAADDLDADDDDDVVVERFDVASSRVAIVVVGVGCLDGENAADDDDEAARDNSRAESLYFGMVLLPPVVMRH